MALDAARQRLVVENLGIAGAVLASLGVPLRGAPWCEAQLALCEAAERFDPALARFSTWAWLRVRWHMMTWLDGERRYRRLGVLTDEPQDVEAEPTPEPLSSALRDALAGLPEAVREVVELGTLGLSKEQVALALGVSVSTVARRRQQARELLRPLRAGLEHDNG